jgi:glycosyltransferase involved in cell wall biosynthesis
MSPSPRTSVIVSTYRRPSYLRETLRSILAQTWEDFEVLVVSDGPSQEDAAVLRTLADPRLRYLSVPHQGGPAQARNEGLAHAQGMLIAFCDDDDLWDSRKLEAQVAALADGRAALCFTGVANMDESSRVTGPRRAPLRIYDRWPRLAYLSLPGYYIAPSSVMVPKRVIDAVGGFDERPLLRGREDMEWFVRIAYRTRSRFVRAAEPLVRYRLVASDPGLGIRVDESHVSALLDAVRENAGMSKSVYRRFAGIQWIIHARTVYAATGDAGRALKFLDMADAHTWSLGARMWRAQLTVRRSVNEAAR